jgi:hypothetical protein
MTKKSRIPKNAVPCAICGAQVIWGSFFLECSGSCRNQSDYDNPRGNAIISWNKQQRKIKRLCAKEIRKFREFDELIFNIDERIEHLIERKRNIVIKRGDVLCQIELVIDGE